jgi:hypothetical protein
MMNDPAQARVDFDARVQDPTILEEIDLYSELMIVAAASAGALSTDAIDQALGLSAVLVVPDDHGLLTIVAN